MERYFTEPSSEEASLGTLPRIVCYAPVRVVSWYKLEGPLWHNVVLDSNGNVHTLYIMGVEMANYGTYVCQYQDDRHGEYVSFYSKSAVVSSGIVNGPL